MLARKGTSQASLVVGLIAILVLGLLVYYSLPTSKESGTAGTSGISGIDTGNIILNADPRPLIIASTTNAYSWVTNYTNVEANGIPEVVETKLAETTIVTGTIFSSEEFLGLVVPDNNTVRAKLYLNILNSGGGTLKVYIGGVKVWGGKPDVGEHVEIPLTPEQLQLGTENEVKITVSKPFFLAFWKANSYELEGVFFDSHVFHAEKANKEIDFSLDSDQVIGLTAATLEAKITKGIGAESKLLYINFGGENIYNNTPGAVNSVIKQNIPLRSFALGNNSISFGTELDGAYLINFVLTLKILNLTSDSYEVYEKNIADDLWKTIQSGQQNNTHSCELYLKRATGSDTVVVWINEHRQELAFDTNDEVTQDVCGLLNKGKNTFILIAEQSKTSDEKFIDVDQISLSVRETK